MTRSVRRWVGHCLVRTAKEDHKGTVYEVKDCPWNDRADKALYLNPAAAVREAKEHAAESHVEAREVKVVRTYTLSKEEVVEP